jgi:crotonobetainyl-CoA:carnitine CoA-transferase CaiB-like acyl-CoA transferase
MTSTKAVRVDGASFLGGIRVLELADELGEYCGKVLAGVGADVIKVEPPGGEATREYGPFYHDTPHPDRSLYFWHYNFGKLGVVIDLDRRASDGSIGATTRDHPGRSLATSGWEGPASWVI